MLLFSTVLDINDCMTKDDFIKLVIEWNQTSPFPGNIIHGIAWNGERNVRYGNDSLWLGIEEYRHRNIIAVRYERRDADGTVWDTDYVMNFSVMKLAVRLDRSYAADALNADPRFSTPHFISMMIKHGYLRDDASLPVLRDPFYIEESNVDIAADAINGKTHYRIPVVYVSSTADGQDPVNVKMLASRLKGVAHVLVQKGSAVRIRLRGLTDGQSEDNGSIGIYYPDGEGKKRFFWRSVTESDSVIEDTVVRAVIEYSSAKMIDTLLTWQGVNNAILRDRLESNRNERLAAEKAQKSAEEEYAKLAGSLSDGERKIREKALEDARAESDALLEGIDEEMKKLQRQVEELTRANEALQYENHGLKTSLDSTKSRPVLLMGDETEFYSGEIKDLLLAVLSDALKGIKQKSRRHDVVTDIIENNDYKKQSEQRAEKVRQLLWSYDGMSAKTRQELKNLGFVITEEGKHYKLTYFGDGRYQLTFAKTPSDFRAGRSCTQETVNLVY